MPLGLWRDTAGRASALVAIFVLAGCGGGSSSEPIVPPEASEIGTLSETTGRQPIIQDATSTADAVESGDIDEALNGVYDLLNEAGKEKDVHVGGAMLREGVPPLANQAEASLPGVRDAINAVRLRTAAGEKFRAFALFLVEEDVRMLVSFREDLAETDSA